MGQRGVVRRRLGCSLGLLRVVVFYHLGASYLALRDEEESLMEDKVTPMEHGKPSLTQKRLVSIADLHGDFHRATEVLVAAGLVRWTGHNKKEYLAATNWEWIAENATLVQLGDIVDRGAFGKQIYELFFHLKRQAPRIGGKVVMLLGNHELMNLKMDWRYVSFKDLQQYDTSEQQYDTSEQTIILRHQSEQKWTGHNLGEQEKEDLMAKKSEIKAEYFKPSWWWFNQLAWTLLSNMVESRVKEWSKDGTLAKKIRKLPALHREGKVLFVHAGLHPDTLGKFDGNITRLNEAMQTDLERSQFKSPLTGRWGPVWTRYLTQEGKLKKYDKDWGVEEPCAKVEELLELAKARRVVVGHTIQQEREKNVFTYYVKSICGERVVLSDTALSSVYGGWKVFLEHDREGGAEAFYPDTQLQMTVRVEIERVNSTQESKPDIWKQSLPGPPQPESRLTAGATH